MASPIPSMAARDSNGGLIPGLISFKKIILNVNSVKRVLSSPYF